MTAPNGQLVYRFYRDMWNRFDKSLIPQLLSDDVTFRGSLGQDCVGHREFGDYVDAVQDAFPDFTNTVEDIVSEGERSFARLTYSGTHRGELFGIAPTEKTITYAGAALFRFQNSLIREVWVLGDIYGLLQQLQPGRN